MHYFEGRLLSASMSTKQHISAILHEASETFDLPFNNPKMQLLRLKEGDSLWGGEQTVRLRLELMLIEIVRSNSYYAEKPRMFFPKEIITDEFSLKIIAFMEEHLYGKFTMDELSRRLSFGKTYISQYFTKTCGYRHKFRCTQFWGNLSRYGLYLFVDKLPCIKRRYAFIKNYSN